MQLAGRIAFDRSPTSWLRLKLGCAWIIAEEPLSERPERGQLALVRIEATPRAQLSGYCVKSATISSCSEAKTRN